MKKILFILCALLSIGASAQVSGNGPRKASYNGHEYVDLGLPSGTLWATCNIGATTPEDYGDYFAWGETTGYNSGKTDFAWSTYKYCNGSSTTMTKYCNQSNYGYNGFTDTLTELEPDDDAAYVNWGANWRMPSYDQIVELVSSYTTTTWTSVNGKYGCKITSKSNGNSIFLPAAGYRYNTSLDDAGSKGHYWSRTLYTSNPRNARKLSFSSSSCYALDYNYRYCGRPVRPVRASILLVETITLTPATLALAVGASSQLTATVTPSNAANPTLTWSSSDTEVAVVGTDGRVVAVAPGTCTITCAATDGSGVKATCKVTVTAAAATAHEYVDLGLPSGTLWATTNLGAASPEDYGHYFAWGETATKASYNNWATYSLCNGSGATQTKYCYVSTYGTVDNLSELESSDDAATDLWGADWLMPTREQLEELVNSAYTTTEWTTQNGV
ncbi:MAG: Ig-like domain-containing protein, partial [Bacteroidaceae bacterium]|nr:Ig-like domain-containing protein [Bacteroidaceae bacterium]